MKDYNRFLSEKLELSGKYSFFNFLDVVNKLNLNFIKNDYYKDLYKDYIFFFTTESFQYKDDIMNILKYKRSLIKSFYTLDKLKENKISIFFGIKSDRTITYGFVDNLSNKSYITGKFNITKNYFKSLKKYKCLELIIKNLNTDFHKYEIYEKIKKDFKKFYKSKPQVKIEKVDNKIIKYIKRDSFTEEEFNSNKPTRILDEWITKKNWKDDIISYFVDEEGQDLIKFIITLK